MSDNTAPMHPGIGKALSVLAAVGAVVALAGLVLNTVLVPTSMALIWVPVVLIAAAPAAACAVWYWAKGTLAAFTAFALTAVPVALVGTVVGVLLGAEAFLQ
ncbi:hypothetical protein [Kytococcus sedentarius]|uniref:hypothetical protein n=1 Tax=Kytococcus sedentarius TaxID=1276 RepID=UPI00195007AE|nr:hypothetical protein [Kytococcus sedentarius]QRO87758.1 hypothetical protein I6J30_01900 [Kytococcus sedentarius]